MEMYKEKVQSLREKIAEELRDIECKVETLREKLDAENELPELRKQLAIAREKADKEQHTRLTELIEQAHAGQFGQGVLTIFTDGSFGNPRLTRVVSIKGTPLEMMNHHQFSLLNLPELPIEHDTFNEEEDQNEDEWWEGIGSVVEREVGEVTENEWQQLFQRCWDLQEETTENFEPKSSLYAGVLSLDHLLNLFPANFQPNVPVGTEIPLNIKHRSRDAKRCYLMALPSGRWADIWPRSDIGPSVRLVRSFTREDCSYPTKDEIDYLKEKRIGLRLLEGRS